MREEIGKRKKKHTAHWLEYQSSQLEEKRSKMYSRLIRKSNAVNGLLYFPRNVETCSRWWHRCRKSTMLCYQLNGKTKVKNSLTRLMPPSCSSSKKTIVGSEILRGKGMLPWKQNQESSASGNTPSRKSSWHSVCHHQAQDYQKRQIIEGETNSRVQGT